MKQSSATSGTRFMAMQCAMHYCMATLFLRETNESFLLEKQRMPKLQHCVYVLLSLKDKNLYIGYSTNLKQRLTDHFHGNSKATAPRRPFRLIFCEYFLAKKDALRREEYFKTSSGKRTIKIMLEESLADQTFFLP